MKPTEWQDVFPEVSDIFHERVVSTLNSQTQTIAYTSKERFKIMKKKTLIVAAAIVAMIGTISVGAYTLLNNWNPKMAEIFQADELMQEKLVNDGMSQAVNLSATDNGVTMDILQTLADENMVYILLRFSSENEKLLDTENFENLWDTIKIEGYDSPYEFYYDRKEATPENVLTFGSMCSNMVSDSKETITDENGNTIHQFYYAIRIHNSFKQDYNGREITLSFRNLGAYEGKAGDFYPIIKGSWEIAWILEYQDHTKVFELNKSVEVNGIDVIVKSLELSPFMINVVIDSDSAKALHDNALENHPKLATAEYSDIINILSYTNFYPILDNGEVFVAMGGGSSGGTGDFSSKRIFDNGILHVERVVGIKADCPMFPEYSFEFCFD
jgi:hypothetical protein